jgi:hypothetical protein
VSHRLSGVQFFGWRAGNLPGGAPDLLLSQQFTAFPQKVRDGT